MLSYFGLGVNTWLINRLVISMFSLSCATFSIALQTRLELLHPWAFFDASVNNKFHQCPSYVMCSWQWAYRDTWCNVRCHCNYINWSWSQLLTSTRVVAHPAFNPNQLPLDGGCCHPLWSWGYYLKQSYHSQSNTHIHTALIMFYMRLCNIKGCIWKEKKLPQPTPSNNRNVWLFTQKRKMIW